MCKSNMSQYDRGRKPHTFHAGDSIYRDRSRKEEETGTPVSRAVPCYYGDGEQRRSPARRQTGRTCRMIQRGKSTSMSYGDTRHHLSRAQRSCIDIVCWAFQLLLIMPATNSTSERSFSAMRRIKNYLRSTMTKIA